MAKALPLVLGAAAVVATGGAAAGLIAASTAAYIGVGLSVAGTLAQTLLAQTPPKPKMQDGDASITQAIPPRVRIYGRQRQGGYYLFKDSTPDGDLKTLICHAAHECDDSTEGNPNPEEDWLNDERVTLDEDGNVTDDPWWQDDDDDSVVVIQHYLGTPTQVIPSFDDKWTVDHKGHGLCCSYIKYSDLKQEDQIKVFPSGPPPHRAVLRGAKIYDPRTAQDPEDEATWAWSDNAALVVLDYMTRLEQGVPVGFGIPFARVDLTSFEAAADICDQEIPIKIEGEVVGAEKRWRAWGAYELTEDKKDVLQDLLDTCGGRLVQGPDGKLGLTVGADRYRAEDEDAYTVPAGVPAATVTLNEADGHIHDWDLNQGKAAIERINEVRATYVSQAWEWAETEAGIQMDQAGQDRNGVESSQIKLRFVPSESQAQRVAREVLRRGNPTHAGRIRTTLAGLDAWGERWIHLVIAELDIDALFEITSMSLNQADMTVTMEVSSYDDWWTWTAETDEQLPAIPPPESDDDAEIPVPEGVAVSIIHRLYNSQTPVAVGLITWDPPPRSVYVAKARYRATPSGPWQPLPVAQDEDQVETFPLADGVGYEAQVRFIGPRGAGSDWSAPAAFTAVADPVAPASPTDLTAQADVPTTDDVTVSATAPNDPRHRSLRFYRNDSNTFSGATLIAGPLYCAPLSTQTYVDTPPGAGDWWYFATSSNWSDVPSTPAGGVLAEITPAAPAITSPSGPLTTYDRRPPVSGTGIAGATIKLFANAVQVGTGTVTGGGTWSVTPSSDLGIGANSMTATQTVDGNESVASGSVAITVNSIDADAWAYIVAMSVTPAYARQTLINTLVAALKTAGVWTKLDAMYLLAAHDAQAARLNLKAPATFALTATSSPTFTTDHGYKGTGLAASTGGYLASGFNPATAGGALTLNSVHLAVWVRTACTASANARDIGNANLRIGTGQTTAGNIATNCNDGTSSATAAGTPNGLGHYLIARTASGSYSKYHTAVAQTGSSVTSTSIASASIDILRSTAATYSDAEVCAAHWGSYLSSTEVTDLYNALHAYLQGVGAVA